jgi:hypothetical protein
MAEIVSRVSGKTFSEWCHENIFKPLNMSHTLFYDDHEKIVKNRAYSFYETPGGLKKSVLSYANAGATSLFTTAADLVKWSDNFQTMKVGNARIMKQMDERGILNKGDTITYAFGQDIGKYKGVKTISHGGADAGYRSFLVRFPEQKYTVAVLSNLASFNTGSLAYKIADIYLKDYLKEEEKKPELEKQKTEAVQVSEELLKLYSGRYELQPGMIVTMRLDNGKLIAETSGEPSFTLVAKTESEFLIAAIGARITFQKNEANVVNQFIFDQAGRTMTASRIKEFDSKSVNLGSYQGTYYSSELETSYTLVVEENKLVAKHIRHEPVQMTPAAENTFTTDVWYMSTVEFTKNEKGEVNGLKASSGRVRNVRFDKIR